MLKCLNPQSTVVFMRDVLRREVDDLRWSHDTIYNHFKYRVSIFETVVHLLFGHVSVDDIPPLRVVKIGDLVYSLSNRRLYALKLLKRIRARFGEEADVFVPVVFEEGERGRSFTTQTCGESVQLSTPIQIEFVRHLRGPKRLTEARKRDLAKTKTRQPRPPSCRPPSHLLKQPACDLVPFSPRPPSCRHHLTCISQRLLCKILREVRSSECT